MSTTACEDAGPAHVEPQDAGSLKRKRADIDQEQEQELTELERFELEEEGEIVVAVATGMETNEAGAGAGAGGAATATGGQRYFTAQGQTHRDNTPTRPMIDFHNFVKRSLYDKVFRRHGRGATLMEMAGGRGGDLWKIKQQNPSEVVLTDLDAEALQEAERRWEGGKRGARMQLRTVAADMRDAQPPGSFRASGNKPVDVCSCQFSLHYFFETEAAFGNMLATLTDTLAPGGTFMCTLFDGGRVCKLLREAGATARGGDVASAPSTAGGGERVWMHGDGDARKRVLQLKRTWEGDGDLTTLFGNKLVVFLDTIGEHPEYAVDAGLFVKRMEAAHFELVEKTGFGDMYDDWMRSRRRHNVSIPQDMQQFSFLYSAYIFRRHGGSNGGATTAVAVAAAMVKGTKQAVLTVNMAVSRARVVHMHMVRATACHPNTKAAMVGSVIATMMLDGSNASGSSSSRRRIMGNGGEARHKASMVGTAKGIGVAGTAVFRGRGTTGFLAPE